MSIPLESHVDRASSAPSRANCVSGPTGDPSENSSGGEARTNSRSASRVSDPCVFGSDWIRIGYVRHQRVRGNRAKSTSFEILKRLHDLVSRVHHKWPVVLDGLPNRLTSQYQNLKVDAAGILRVMVPDGDPVSGSERHQLATMHPLAAAANSAGSGQDVESALKPALQGTSKSAPGEIVACISAIGV